MKINILFTHTYLDDSNLLAMCGPSCPSCVPSCFLKGTKVQTPDGEKNIETIKVGDLVSSYNFSGSKITQSRVEKIIHAREPLFNILNKQIKVTPYHRFWINNNSWQRVKELEINQTIYRLDGKMITLDSIETVQSPVEVFNLSLMGVHKNYFADKILVHNEKCA